MFGSSPSSPRLRHSLLMSTLATRPIFVVDDESLIRDGFSMALRSAGFEVELASDGSEALERYQEIAPECIVLDLHMPRMDGLQAAHSLRAGGYNGPIVLACSSADHRTAITALGEGITDFLTKPVRPTHLRYTVSHSIDRHNRFVGRKIASHEELSLALYRGYAKYCLANRRRAEAKAALHALTARTSDLQSFLLLGALYELEDDMERAAEFFVLAAEAHSRHVSVPASFELFRVFSHSDHSDHHASHE